MTAQEKVMWLAIVGDVVQAVVIAWIVQRWRRAMMHAADVIRRFPASEEAYPTEEDLWQTSSGGFLKRRRWNWQNGFTTPDPATASKSASTTRTP